MSDLINLSEKDEKTQENRLIDQFDPITTISSTTSHDDFTSLPPLPHVPDFPHSTTTTIIKPKLPERKQSLARNSYPSNLRPNALSSPRKSSLSNPARSSLEIIHQSSSSNQLERSQSTMSTSNRFSGCIQEPDSPATCLSLKIMRARLRYRADDLTTNPGIIFAQQSSRITHCADVKILVSLPNGTELPSSFTRNIESTCADLTKIIRAECQIVHTQLCPVMRDPSFQFLLRIDQTGEYLRPKMMLHELRIVRECLKLNIPMRVTCRPLVGLERPFQRSKEDDLNAQVAPVLTSLTPAHAISDKELEIVLALCFQKCDDLLVGDNELPLRHRFGHLEQSIKALVSKLGQVETSELSNAIISVQAALAEPVYLAEATDKIKDAIHDLIALYQNPVDLSESGCLSIEDVTEPLTIKLVSLHQIPPEPQELLELHNNNKVESMWVAISIVRGDGASCCRKVATGRAHILRSMFPRVIWNQNLTMDIEIKTLPLDAALLCELYCTTTVEGKW